MNFFYLVRLRTFQIACPARSVKKSGNAWLYFSNHCCPEFPAYPKPGPHRLHCLPQARYTRRNKDGMDSNQTARKPRLFPDPPGIFLGSREIPCPYPPDKFQRAAKTPPSFTISHSVAPRSSSSFVPIPEAPPSFFRICPIKSSENRAESSPALKRRAAAAPAFPMVPDTTRSCPGEKIPAPLGIRLIFSFFFSYAPGVTGAT